MISIIFKCVNIYFYDPEYGLFLWMFQCRWKECLFCCCWVECSVNVKQTQFVDSVFQFFYIFADFLSVLLITERSVEVSNYNYGFVYFFFPSVSYCFMCFETLFLGAYLLRIVVFLVNWASFYYVDSLSLPDSFIYFEVCFVWKSIFYLDQYFHSISFNILLLLTYR